MQNFNCCLIILSIFAVVTIFFSYNIFQHESNLDEQNLADKSNLTILNIDQMKFDVFPNGVPKLIHYTINDETKIPVQYKSLIQSCIKVNPDVKFVLSTDKSILSLIKIHYPQKESSYLSYLTGESEKLKKSDIARPFIIYKYGGIYMDLDTKCQKPLRDVMIGYKHSCIFSSDHEIKLMVMYNRATLAMNSFIACIPHHNFFYFYINRLTHNVKGHILWTTGPFHTQAILDEYNKNYTKYFNYKSYYIGIGDWRIFSPFLEYKISCENSVSNTLKYLACQQYSKYDKSRAKDIAAATVVHMFMNLGYTTYIETTEQTFHVKIFNDSVTVGRCVTLRTPPLNVPVFEFF